MFIQSINAGLRKIPTLVLYIIVPIPGLLAIAAGLTDNLGPEPINELEEQLGEFALKLLIVGLAVSPLFTLYPDQSGAIPPGHRINGFRLCLGAFLGLVLAGSAGSQSNLD